MNQFKTKNLCYMMKIQYHISNVDDLKKVNEIFSAYIFYDFETSGRSARFDQILQLVLLSMMKVLEH